MLQNIDHINIVVEDLEGMIQFYQDTLELKKTKEVTISGEWVENVVGLKNVEAKVVYLDLPSGPRVELIKYLSPKTERPMRIGESNSPGIRHFAFRVNQLDTLVEKLKRADIRFFSQVQKVPDTQVTYAGGVQKRLVYFHDPEGNLLEFCEYT